MFYLAKFTATVTICFLRVSVQDKIEDFGLLEVDEIPIGEISKRPLCLQIPR